MAVATQSVQRGEIPAHVPADLVVDFDAYRPIQGGEDYQTAFSRLSDGARGASPTVARASSAAG